MKFLVDAQLPPALARWLREAGHDAQAVRELGLREAEDADFWKHALANDAAIITKDEDFPRRAHQTDVAPVVVWLCVGNVSNHALQRWFLPQVPAIVTWIGEGTRVLEVR